MEGVRVLMLIAVAVLIVAFALLWPKPDSAFTLPAGYPPGRRLAGAYPLARPGPTLEGWRFEAGYRAGEVLQWIYVRGDDSITLIEAPDRVRLPDPWRTWRGRQYWIHCRACDARVLLGKIGR